MSILKCGISNMPIIDGDNVRLTFLVKRKETWYPRFISIKCKYYDSKIELTEDTFVNFVVDSFKNDLIERETGNNLLHDVPITKDMDFHKLIDSIYEKRLFVYDDLIYKNEKCETTLEVNHQNVPTKKSIESFINEIDDINNFNITKLQENEFIVRCCSYGDSSKKLTLLQKKLVDFSTMLSAHDWDEVILHVKPKRLKTDKDGFYHYGLAEKSPYDFTTNHSLPISFMMIKENVWQGMLQLKNNKSTIKTYDKHLDLSLKEVKKQFKTLNEYSEHFIFHNGIHTSKELKTNEWFYSYIQAPQFWVASLLKIFVRDHKISTIEKEHTSEFMFVFDLLKALNIDLKPFDYSNDTNIKLFNNFNLMLSKIRG